MSYLDPRNPRNLSLRGRATNYVRSSRASSTSNANGGSQQQRMASNTNTNTHHSQQQSMASPQGVKRDAGSLFLAVEQAENEASETNDPLAADGLPTPNTPTFKKKFKTDVAEDFDILSKLNINDDGKVAPYDAFKSELLPRLAVYHDSFNMAEEKVPKVCDLFLEAFKNEDYYNQEIELICQRDLMPLLKLQNFYAKPGPIALLGGAGNGKSSLINNLVSIPGLVKESDAAERGTNLVHELTTASPKQFSKYLVAVPYLADTQIKTIVQQHCNNIFKFLEMDEADEELTEDEKELLQKAYDTSVEFFRILLCDRVDLKSDEDALDFFQSRRARGEDALVNELKKHIDDFKATRALEDGVEYHDAQNVQQLADVFRSVARVPPNTDAHPPKPHPWPLLTKIQIRLDNLLLNLIPPLADTPGTTDNNQDVVNATKSYIDEAGIIFIVERARRVAAQGTLDVHLKECIRRNKVNCIVLILTAIDDVQIIKDYDRSELLSEDRKQLESAETLVEQLKHEEYSLKQRRTAIMAKETPDVTDFESIRTIDRESEEVSIKIACAEQKVKQVVVQIRFRQAAESVKGKLRTLERNPRAPDLKVYGVSNPQYQQHLYGYDAKKPPMLDVEGTGLPELRQLLYTIPAEGKAATLRRICQNILPAIFKGIIGILTKSRLERKKEVETVITNIMKKYKKVAKHTIAELDRSFESHVVEAIDQNRFQWEERAQKLLDGWDKTTYRGVTFMAFCRRSGRFKPKNKEEACWNDKIQNLMVDKLVEGFNAFDADLPNIESLNATKIDALFRKLIESLQECQDFQGAEGADEFYHHIRTVRDRVLEDSKAVFSELRHDIRAVRHACTIEQARGHASTYVAQAMQPAYDRCNEIRESKDPAYKAKKGGKRIEMVDVIKRQLRGTEGEKSIFTSVLGLVEEAFSKIMIKWEDEDFTPKLKEAYGSVMESFNGQFTVSDEVKTEENEEAVARLKVAALTALEIIDGPMKEHLDRCDRFEKGLED